MLESLKRILERNIAPRWFIFLLDISIMWSVFLLTTIFVSHDGKLNEILFGHRLQIMLSVIIFATIYLIIKPHHNIIRHSTMQDFLTIIFVQGLCSLGLLLLVLLNGIAPKYLQFRILYSEIIIHFFISGFLLIFLRIVFRFVSSYLLQGPQKTRKTLIFGAGRLGLMARSIIERDNSYNYHILGFIDDNPNLVGKRRGGMRIYSISKK